MIIQQAWACIIGLASTVMGTLRFLSIINIPRIDAWVHVLTGMTFIAGAWIQRGKFVRITNFSLGIIYILFGIWGGFNWPHMIAGIISVIISLVVKPVRAI